jgi:hypothetical protein
MHLIKTIRSEKAKTFKLLTLALDTSATTHHLKFFGINCNIKLESPKIKSCSME